MGISIPQVITPSKASGAQVIDGSLKFGDSTDATGPYLTRTASAGNRKTWTLSCWIKRNVISDSNDQRIFTGRDGDASGTQGFIKFQSTDVIQYVDSANSASIATTAKFRDTGWYHLTAVLDASNTTFYIYINGQQQTLTGTQPSNADGNINNNILHAISYDYYSGGTGEHTDTLMSQFYFIDGQVLDASYFGFTDPLTNTWKPKKYTGTFGTNGFYLSMDGNSPIGKDQSGNGNDWTPVNLGGSVSLDNPQVSGAKPILNTTQGGSQAGVGVFGSKQNVGYAVTVYNDGGGNKYYIDGVKQDTVTGST